MVGFSHDNHGPSVLRSRRYQAHAAHDGHYPGAWSQVWDIRGVSAYRGCCLVGVEPRNYKAQEEQASMMAFHVPRGGLLGSERPGTVQDHVHGERCWPTIRLGIRWPTPRVAGMHAAMPGAQGGLTAGVRLVLRAHSRRRVHHLRLSATRSSRHTRIHSVFPTLGLGSDTDYERRMSTRTAGRKLVILGMCGAPAVALLLFSIEDRLLKAGQLGTKDLWPIGTEAGTLGEYVENVWFWDAALMLVFMASLVMCIRGICIMARHEKDCLREFV